MKISSNGGERSAGRRAASTTPCADGAEAVGYSRNPCLQFAGADKAEAPPKSGIRMGQCTNWELLLLLFLTFVQAKKGTWENLDQYLKYFSSWRQESVNTLAIGFSCKRRFACSCSRYTYIIHIIQQYDKDRAFGIFLSKNNVAMEILATMWP